MRFLGGVWAGALRRLVAQCLACGVLLAVLMAAGLARVGVAEDIRSGLGGWLAKETAWADVKAFFTGEAKIPAETEAAAEASAPPPPVSAGTINPLNVIRVDEDILYELEHAVDPYNAP